ncbi:MAG TPA: VPDSG-CTERM sorting domain-containing protein [Methylomirabilota bacterium]|nr:VPDSG-CTERM sorting domain-containing protein [Methylomirabilota bacterium]
MNMRSIALLVVISGLLNVAPVLHALTIDKTYLIGHVEPGSPSGLAVEEDRLEYFIDRHNGLTPAAPDGNTYTLDFGTSVFPPLPPLPGYDGNSTGQIGAAATSLSIDVTGWEYLMVKWANDSYYYYVGGLTGTHTVVNDVVFNNKGKPQDASHYRFFGGTHGVPDGGSTLLLLGSVLTGLTLLRRKLA